MKTISKRKDVRHIWQRKIYGAHYMVHKIFATNVVLVFKRMYDPQAWEERWVCVHIFEEGDPDGPQS
jgi:hypothetical protein